MLFSWAVLRIKKQNTAENVFQFTDPSCIYVQGYFPRGLSGRNVKLTTQPHLVSILRISGATSSFCSNSLHVYMPQCFSWSQGITFTRAMWFSDPLVSLSEWRYQILILEWTSMVWRSMTSTRCMPRLQEYVLSCNRISTRVEMKEIWAKIKKKRSLEESDPLNSVILIRLFVAYLTIMSIF